MTVAQKKQERTEDLVINAVIQGITNEDLQLTRDVLNELISKKNAYICDAKPSTTKWNMITYKTGRKSSL